MPRMGKANDTVVRGPVVTLKQAVPWWGKIAAKLVLSRLPFGYRFWHRMNVFVHGAMENPEYALGVVRKHVARVGRTDLSDATIVELGPGDSVSTALIAKALGAKRIILVDVGDFATRDPGKYQRLADYLRGEGLSPPELTGCTSREDVLALCGAEYHTQGLASLRSLDAGIADFVFSHAVLAHVRRAQLGETLREMFRVTKRGGSCSHQIDLRDHLGGALNHLRFSDRLWEADWMARSGFYSNRFRFAQVLDLFRQAGWNCDVTNITRWSALPTPRRALAAPFRLLNDDELLVSDFAVRGRKQ